MAKRSWSEPPASWLTPCAAPQAADQATGRRWSWWAVILDLPASLPLISRLSPHLAMPRKSALRNQSLAPAKSAKCDSEQARAKQHKTGKRSQRGTVRSEFFTHGTSPIARERAKLIVGSRSVDTTKLNFKKRAVAKEDFNSYGAACLLYPKRKGDGQMQAQRKDRRGDLITRDSSRDCRSRRSNSYSL